MARIAVFAMAFVALALPAGAQAAPQWFDGNVAKSTITNCGSIIIGQPYQEDGAWAWTGFFDDDNNLTGINTVYYGHVVVGGVGNACSGQRALTEVSLPTATSLQISGAHPVYCWLVNTNTNPDTVFQETTACDQNPSAGLNGGSVFEALGEPGGTWPLPQGWIVEVQFPMASTQALMGIFDNPCSCLTGQVKVLDGNSSPLLQPNAGIVVVNTPGGGSTPSGGGGGGKTIVQTPPPPRLPPALGSVAGPGSFKTKKAAKKGIPITIVNNIAGSTIDVVLVQGATGASALGRTAKETIVGRATRKNAPKGKVTLKVKLTRKAAKKFKRKRKVKLLARVTVTPPAGKGKPAVGSKKVTLKR